MEIIIVLLIIILFILLEKIEYIIMESNQLQDNISMRKLVVTKQRFETGKLIIVLTAILIGGTLGYLDKTATGTLLGTIVGYFFSGNRKQS